MMKRVTLLRPLTVLVLAGMLGMLAVPVSAQHPQGVPPIAEPTSVVAADLDGDGDADVLSASRADGKIAWYENDGTGQFSPQKTITTQAHGARAVATADLDGDGDADVVSASQEDGTIAWYENDGSGTFSAPKPITARTASFWDVATTDADGDGDRDVIAVSLGKAVWFENRLDASGPDRGFSPPRVLDENPGRTVSVHTADLDGDGRSDVLIAARSGAVAWFKNEEEGAFSSSRVIAQAGRSTSVHTADVNGDGAPDVLFTADGSGDVPEGTTVAWSENQIGSQGLAGALVNGGGFGAPQAITAKAQGPQSVFAADIDGDGATDVLSASEYDNRVAWYRNEGDGAFSDPRTITSQAVGAWSVYAADLDGDDDPDVLSAAREGHTVSWSRNEGSSGFSEPRILTAGFGSLQDWTLADLSGDGNSDLLAASESAVLGYRNRKEEGFAYASHIAGGLREPAAFAVADLDADGDPDVVIGSKQKLLWGENDGVGTFSDTTLITSDVYEVSAVATADRDNDGDPDVIVAASRGEDMSWYENTGDGFSASAELAVGPGRITTIRSADLDGDGDQDLLTNSSTSAGPQPECCIPDEPPPPGSTASEAEDSPSAGIKWYENTEGSFSRHPINDDPSGTLHTADLDGDADLDIVASGIWYENDGRGDFSAHALAANDREMSTGSVGDLNGDGHPDLLVPRSNRDVWYENDGTGTFADRAPLTSFGGSSALAVADANGDGKADVLSARAEITRRFLVWYVNTGHGFEVDPKVAPPPPPSDLTITTSADGVTLEWSASDAEDLRGYVIYRSTSSFGEAPPAKSDSHTMAGAAAGTTTYTDADLRDGTTYYYEVVATDWDNNESRASREVKVPWPPGSDGGQ